MSAFWNSGPVTTEKIGRMPSSKLGLRRLDGDAAWIARARQFWEDLFDDGHDCRGTETERECRWTQVKEMSA